MNKPKRPSAHDNFVKHAMASSAKDLQATLDEVVASVTGTIGSLPVYENHQQFFALPFVISTDEWAQWRAASEFLIRCIYRYVSRRYTAEGETFLLSLGIQPEQVELLSLAGSWPRLEHTMARPDFFQGPAGPVFLEANIDSSLGGLGTSDPLCRIIAGGVTVTRYMGDVSGSTRLMPTFAQLIRNVAKNTTSTGTTVMIVDWQDEIDESPWPYEWLANDLRKQGLKVIISSEHSFRQYQVPDFIYRGITPVDKLWKQICSFDEVWKAVGSGVPILSTLWDVVLSSKAVLGEMWYSMEQCELDPEDADFVRTHVLWTWPIARRECVRGGRTIETLDFAIKMQNGLVLKSPSDGSCKNIIVGKYCTREKWLEALINAAARLGYVLQEYYEPPLRWNVDGYSTKVQWREFTCVDSVFVFGGLASGTCIRGSTPGTPYISCMHGAREGIALTH